MNHCLFKAKDTKGAVGNTVDYSSLTFYKKNPNPSLEKYQMDSGLFTIL